MTEILERVAGYRTKNASLTDGLPEAGGIAFCTVFLGGMPINVTARATNPYDAIASLVASLTLARDALGIVTERESAPVPKIDPAAAVAAKAGNQEAAAELQAQADEVPPPPDGGGEWLTQDVSRVQVLPQPDDKCNVEFFSGSHKYPDVKVVKWQTASVAGLLRHVTSHDVSTPGDFSLPCRVYYTLGREYSKPDGTKGNYRDVAHVRPL